MAQVIINVSAAYGFARFTGWAMITLSAHWTAARLATRLVREKGAHVTEEELKAAARKETRKVWPGVSGFVNALHWPLFAVYAALLIFLA